MVDTIIIMNENSTNCCLWLWIETLSDSIHEHGDYKSGPTDISSKSLRFLAAFSKRKESAVKLFASERKQPFHLSDLFVY